MRRSIILLILSILVISRGCNTEKGPESSSDTLFTLLTSEKTGITFRNDLEEDVHDEAKNIISFDFYFNGAGVATADFNNDGLIDIFFCANEGKNELYINKGDFKFENITETADINVNKRWSTGVTVADINGDGYMDIYVCQSGPNHTSWNDKANLLFINNGDLTFTEKAKEYGLDNTNIGTQAAFFDYDLDGDLDCFVMNESKYRLVSHREVYKDLESETNLRRASCTLYRNDNNKFKDVSKEAGILNWSFGLGLGISDFNKDGFPDIYVGNDYAVPDKLWINNGDGTFTDQIKSYTNQISFFSMGLDIADINNDGYQDIAVVDMAADDHFRSKTLMESMDTDMFWYYINTRKFHYQYMFNSFQLNNGDDSYSNIANMLGVAQTDWSWAALLADLDNDGFKDYFVTNGYKRYTRDNDFRIKMDKIKAENNGVVPANMRQKLYDEMPSIKLPNRMYKNDQHLNFIPVEDQWGTNQSSFSSGAAYADLDNDGDLDLIVNNTAMEAFVYKNNAESVTNNNFVKVILDWNKPTTNALVEIKIGNQIQIQEKMNTRGYISAVDDRLHFGLGEKTMVDQIKITWPDGNIQLLNDIPANQILTVKYETGVKELNEEPIIAGFDEIDPKSIGLDFQHVENPYNDFKKQVLLPQKQSMQGPALAVGDVNGDELDDIFIGGAAGQAGKLYVQQSDGSYTYDSENQFWNIDKNCEDVAATFYDADGDGDNDLYVVSGGYEYDEGAPQYLDRLYINMGQGKFIKVKQGLPNIPSPGSCVKACDFDKDGDMDLFIGGKAVPGKYPFAAPSVLLEFNNFNFTNSISKIKTNGDLGMVTDCAWVDYDGDGWQDLVLVGEWMTPRLFKNNQGILEEVSDSGFEKYSGWWQSVTADDLDGDGDMDFIMGNLGLNSKFSASDKKPFKVYASDFDQNGTCDVILTKKYKDREVPTRGRECSSEQMPFILEKFDTYSDFANASVIDIIGESGEENALKLMVNDFASKVFINNNGKFEAYNLPMEAQKAPILATIVKDFNEDGKKDLLLVGNIFETEVETARYDAGTGQILLAKDNYQFTPLNVAQSGIKANKNCKDAKIVRGKDDYSIIIVNNDDKPQIYTPRHQQLAKLLAVND
jgi:hypothetical protein